MKPITSAPWRKPIRRGRPVAKPGSTIDPALRSLVLARAKSRCECCGDPLRRLFECHHRKLRSRGGQDSACNLLALCTLCHRRVHGHPAWATEHGLMVAATDDPAAVPVAVGGERWVLLTADGAYREAAA